MTDAPIEHFTPLFQWVLDATGDLSCTATYGIVWRYAQMRDAECRASCARLAREMGWSRQRVMRHLRSLSQAGLIRCVNPQEHGVPHRFEPLTRDQWQAAAGRAPAEQPPDASCGIPCSTMEQPVPAPQHSRHGVEHPPVTPHHIPCHAVEQEPVTACDTSDSIKKEDRIGVRESCTADGARRRPRRTPALRSPGPSRSQKEEENAPDADAAPRPAGSDLVRRLLGRRAPGVLRSQIDAAVPPGTGVDDLRPYYQTWCARGYNPRSLAWLFEWFAAGRIPAAPQGVSPCPRQENTTATREEWDKWADFQKAVLEGESPDEAKRRLGL